MYLDSFVKILTTLSIWPGKVDENGKLMVKFINIKTFFFFIIYGIGSGIFVWRLTIPKLLDTSLWTVTDMILFILNHFIIYGGMEIISQS